MMSATAHSHPAMHTDRDFSSPMSDLVDGQGHQVQYHTEEDQARYLYAKMLFEHTQRQYARACNRIIRQGQMQQENEKQEENGVM